MDNNVKHRSKTRENSAKKQASNELVGRNEARRIRKASAKGFATDIEKSFRTDKYMTRNSSWTPVMNPYCNNQLYQERIELIGNWFSMWTDAQRKNFLKYILQRSTKLQHKFVKEQFFSAPLPIQKADFTKILPRFLSMYIFSFLDPRTLSRACQVTWHWKFISEQDEVWSPKCLKLGWFLPYTPTELEYGSWKHHYIICTSTLDKEPPSQIRRDNIYSRLEEEIEKEKLRKIKSVKRSTRKDIIFFKNDIIRRPPWLDTDPKPKDLDDGRKALLADYNPNQSTSMQSLRAERLGLTTKGHHRSLTVPTDIRDRSSTGVTLKRSSSVGEMPCEDDMDDKRPINTSQLTLTEALAIESDLKPGIIDQPWQKIAPMSTVTRNDVTVGFHPSLHESMIGTGHWSKFQYNAQHWNPNPSIILISSEIPASEVLLDATLLGVIAIPYQYQSTTLESLLEKIKLSLKGRQARSIALFCCSELGTIRLAQGHIVSATSLHEPDMKAFWEVLTTSIIPRSHGGHVDVFIPLTETENGMDLLVQLGLVTDMQFSCPTGMTGSYAKVESEWLYYTDNTPPAHLYFETNKLTSWSRLVDYLEEATDTIRSQMLQFFEEGRNLVARKVVGEIVFKYFGLQHVEHLSTVATMIVKAIETLRQKTTDYTLESLLGCVINYLQKKCNQNNNTKRLDKSTEVIDNEKDYDSDCDNNDENDGFTEILSKRLGEPANDKRTSVAQEILQTETEYMTNLNIVQEIFRTRLQASLKSNRPIISLPNIKTLFDDMSTLLEISCVMVNELSKRLEKNKWNAHQCIGDIFLKFTTTSRAYTNFLNNYPIILETLKRVQEQNRQFRCFMSRHEKQPSTKMMSFPEFLLLPGKRVKSYVDLLTRYLRHTPKDHVDRRLLVDAIQKIQDMADIFQQYEERLSRQQSFRQLQETIENCPVLHEKGRHLVCCEDLALLSSPTTGKHVKPEYRYYLHCGDVGVFLFNDCVVVAGLTYHNIPFKRLVKRHYKFHACVSLRKLKLQSVADTRYLKHAFVLFSPKRMWICQASSWEQKLRLTSIMESTIALALTK